jgi:hypothetical protein
MEEDSFRLWQIITTILGSILVLVGLVLTIIHFNKKQQGQLILLEKQIQSQRAENKELNLNNFQNSFWEKQLELYIQASSSAATLTQFEIASSQYKESRATFYTLFWGPMSVVEDLEVKRAMEGFSNQLLEYEAAATKRNLDNLSQKSFQLARTCRESSIKRWGLKEFELEQDFDPIRDKRH